MERQIKSHRNGNSNQLSWLLTGLFISGGQLLSASLVQAHEVQISGEVGGTIHIEPNDAPTAGKAHLAWFALTRRGSQPIALADCSCTLAVYPQPRQPNDVPIQQPTLAATAAEGK